MAANRLRLTSLKLLHKYHVCNAYRVQKSLYCSKNSGNEEPPSENASGFAKFDQKQKELMKEPETPSKKSDLRSTAKPGNEEPASQSVSGFAKFDQKQTELMEEPETPSKESDLYSTAEPGNEEPPSENASGFAKFDQKQKELMKELETPGRESKSHSTAKPGNEEPASESVSGFAKFDQKQTELMEEPETSAKESSFVSLLRSSNFIAMGDPVGKIVIGKIYHVVGKDLYIDFGWKFPTVCTAPERNNEFYVVGTSVKLLIKDLELSTKFLGGEEEITLCEADCVLLGLVNPPSSKRTST